MKPIPFDESNDTLQMAAVWEKGPPQQVAVPLHLDFEKRISTTVWEPSADEMAEFAATGKLYVRVWCEMPNMTITPTSPFDV